MSPIRASVSARYTSRSLPGFARLDASLRRPEPFLKAAAKVIRDTAAGEFRDRAWYHPSGGKRPWKRRVPFGNKRDNGKILIDSGQYFSALMGRGPGAITVIGKRSVKVGVSEALVPYASYIRGGRTRSDIVIKPRKRVARKANSRAWVTQWALWWYLGRKFGVWLTEETLRKGIKIPARPHLTTNPLLRKRLAALMERYIRTGRAR